MSRLIPVALVLAAWSCADPGPGPAPGHPSPEPPPSWGVPLTGGTLLVTHDGRHAVIADPDRDRVVTVDLTTRQVVADLALSAGDEPGRLVEDGAGRIHIALRRGGAVATLAAPTPGASLTRRAVCSEPRGIAYDPATDQLHVACSGGELVSLPASGGALPGGGTQATRQLRLDRDLRDVVVVGTQLMVTRFRTAELLTLDAQGEVIGRVVPPVVKREVGAGLPVAPGSEPLVDAVPAVAWRMLATPDGRLVIAHQRQVQTQLGMFPGGYGGSCPSGIVESAVTVVSPGAAPVAVAPIAIGALPIDLAISRDGAQIAVLSAGNHHVALAPAAALSAPDGNRCPSEPAAAWIDDQLGAPSSVAFGSDGALLVYYPEVPAIVVHSGPAASGGVGVATTIELPGPLGYDAGRAMFHAQTQLGIACASCHPEGRDDGLVWDFAELGLRRTQSLGGHVLRRAPYHWSADLADLDQLMDSVFSNRMAGGAVTHSERVSLGAWLDRIPAPVAAAAIDPAATARGQHLFESAELACTTCHAGELFTNNQRFDVGTGGVFKVPSLLGVGVRPPYLHDGCAATLADRFGACGGGDLHGHTSALTAPELADLIAYLEAL